MQKYFLHKDGRQVGPYSKEDLQQIRITRDTMIWFDGQADWQEASAIEELSDLFINQPPPFQPKNPTQDEPKKPVKKHSDSPKNTSAKYLVVGFIVFAIITYFTYNNQQRKQDALQEELVSQQEELQKQRERQQAQQQAQEEAEAQRLEEEERQKEFEKLKVRYNNAVSNLRDANAKLDKIQEFHFLRTFAEKEAQVENQLVIIKSWENEVDRLKNELSQF